MLMRCCRIPHAQLELANSRGIERISAQTFGMGYCAQGIEPLFCSVALADRNRPAEANDR